MPLRKVLDDLDAGVGFHFGDPPARLLSHLVVHILPIAAPRQVAACCPTLDAPGGPPRARAWPALTLLCGE